MTCGSSSSSTSPVQFPVRILADPAIAVATPRIGLGVVGIEGCPEEAHSGLRLQSSNDVLTDHRCLLLPMRSTYDGRVGSLPRCCPFDSCLQYRFRPIAALRCPRTPATPHE